MLHNPGSPLGGFCPMIIVICIVSDNLGAINVTEVLGNLRLLATPSKNQVQKGKLNAGV